MLLIKGVRSVILLCLLVCFTSCLTTVDDEQLNEALEYAGDNRAELERVLDYYREDSLKYKAAHFLIRNMPGHYSYADTAVITRYSHEVDSIVGAMKDSAHAIIRDSINASAIRCGVPYLKMVDDVKIIKADYLIRNIDDAFCQWQQGHWARHLSFDDFCEYLLPYKAKELQLLDDWRFRLKSYHAKNLHKVGLCDIFAESALAAARTLHWSLRDSISPNHYTNFSYTNMRLESKAHVPFGTCEHYADIMSVVMMAHGIPVMQDFTPQWAFRDLGHSWNIVLANSGKNIPFSGICSAPGDPHKPDEKMAKTYRNTYAQNLQLKKMRLSGEYLPPLFRNIFMRDVTKEYITCRDVEVACDDVKNRFVYLAVFNDRDWTPVAFAENKGGHALFRDMGVDVLYMLVTFSKTGEMSCIGNPFILNFDGSIQSVEADERKKRHVSLTRKYPTLDYVYDVLPRMEGGEFQASDDPDFKTYHLIHRISDCRAIGFQIDVPDSIPPCRYWRYYTNRRGAFNSMAEMMFFEPDHNQKSIGKPFGWPESWDPARNYNAVFDGDILTYFDAMPDESWVGLDFGRSVKMDHLIYYGRGDGNGIEVGDLYELFMWNNGEWDSLGRTTATEPILTFGDVPQGGLYLLKDLTKGEDERIFTYENGKQVWW